MDKDGRNELEKRLATFDLSFLGGQFMKPLPHVKTHGDVLN